MTENMEELVASISINQIMIAVLEEYKSLTVPTLKFLESGKSTKELVIDYDESGPLFTFSLRDKIEQQ